MVGTSEDPLHRITISILESDFELIRLLAYQRKSTVSGIIRELIKAERNRPENADADAERP